MAEGVLLPIFQFLDANGNPLSGAKIYFYEAGSSTLKDTYQEQSLVTVHANPVIADSAGMAEIWLDGLYKMNVLTSADAQVPGYPLDNISWSPAISAATLTEWVSPADVPTYLSATQFVVPNDKRTTYQVGRRIKATVTAGTVYSIITAVSFASSTTTVTVSGGSLDAGLSVIDVGILTTTNTSIPKDVIEIDDATSLIHAVAAQQISSGEFVYAVTTGAADVYVLALTPTLTTLTQGGIVRAKIHTAALTTTPQFNIDTQGNKTAKRENGAALLVGDLPTSHQAVFLYDGTDLILLNPALVQSHGHSAVNDGGALGQASGTDLTLTGAAASPPDVNTLTKENIVKGWISFSGAGTIAINNSFNVSGIVDDGVGLYTITWDTDFADINYVLAGIVNLVGSTVIIDGDTWAVGSCVIRAVNPAVGTNLDPTTINILAIGDQ